MILDYKEREWIFISTLDFYADNSKAYPAELAMVKFSLNRGIIQSMHAVRFFCILEFVN